MKTWKNKTVEYTKTEAVSNAGVQTVLRTRSYLLRAVKHRRGNAYTQNNIKPIVEAKPALTHLPGASMYM